MALNCNIFRNDCQARGKSYKLEHSYGDADAYVYDRKNKKTLLKNERNAYHRRFDNDYFVSDAMYAYKQFFRHNPNGFFMESGALDGSVYGSNSYYFERYLGWKGLLIEASLQNFRRLQIRRTCKLGIHCVHTALCSFDGWTTIPSGGGCCSKVGHGNEKVLCTSVKTLTRVHNVSRIDFWSLDVEGGEVDVLRGVDWNIPIHVILIESVTSSIRTLLRSRGFRNQPFHSLSKLNELWVNDANAVIMT